MDADFAAVEIGFYVQCWSCFSELDVGWSESLLFIFKRQNELRKSQAGADITLSDMRLIESAVFEPDRGLRDIGTCFISMSR